MDTEIINMADHMKHLGQSLLGHSLEHSVFSAMGNSFWHAFGVLHAAQAAEILIKAAIAKEHPLLIFSELPKVGKNNSEKISIDQLLQKGKTLQYSQLPDISGRQLDTKLVKLINITNLDYCEIKYSI